MGTQIEYSQEKELDEALDKLLHSFPCFTPLLDNVKVAACFCVRTDDNEATVSNLSSRLGRSPPSIRERAATANSVSGAARTRQAHK